MTTQELKIYKESRKPFVSKYFVPVIQGKASYCLRNAKYKAEIVSKFEALEDQGFVRLHLEPDYCSTFEDLAGDTYDIDSNASTVNGGERTIKAQEKAERERIDRDGVWGLIGQVKCSECGQWKDIDSVWGFVGEDWKDSGYDVDIMAACVDSL
jgi:hypothetical protein